MAQFRRIYGYQASSFGAIFAPLSRLNKPPLGRFEAVERLNVDFFNTLPTFTPNYETSNEVSFELKPSRLGPLAFRHSSIVVFGIAWPIRVAWLLSVFVTRNLGAVVTAGARGLLGAVGGVSHTSDEQH